MGATSRSIKAIIERRSRWRAGLLLLATTVLGLGSPQPAVAATEQDSLAFRDGVADYRSGQYEAALRSFLSARHDGLNTPNLSFNLGLTYYQLGRYYEARTEFEPLYVDPAYSAMAEYHLGLTAARQGNRAAAIAHLLAAEANANTPAMASLAHSLLGRLRGETPARPRRPRPAGSSGSVYLSAGAGYDSNPTLLPEGGITSAQGAGAFAELFGELAYTFAADGRSSDEFKASAYARQYQSETDFDLQTAQIGLRHELCLDDWRIAALGQGEMSWVGGDPFQRTVTAGIEASHKKDLSMWTLQYRAGRVFGSDAYRYLDGWRHRAGVEYSRGLPGGRLRAGYEFEYNDRSDRTGDAGFFSESPTRSRLSLRWRSLPFAGQLSFELGARYRYSQYADANRFIENGTAQQRRRTEKQLDGEAVLRYRFDEDWNALLQYQYTRNRSNFDDFTFTRHLAILAIEWAKDIR